MLSMKSMTSEFPLRPDLIYLNHAAVAPWPKRCAEAVQRFSEENVTTGALHYPRWNAVEKQLKNRLATLLNAPSADDIALLKNTSEAERIVACADETLRVFHLNEVNQKRFFDALTSCIGLQN